MHRDALDTGRDQQHLRVQTCSEQRRGPVLVDDGVDGVEAAVGIARNGNAAASAGDHHHALANEALD